MQKLTRTRIDWKKTGIRLRNLRDHNPELQRYACWVNHAEDGRCLGDCQGCDLEMDRNVSRAELAAVFHTTESVIANWESGRTSPELEDLFFYAALCRLTLEDILVFEA